MTGTDVLERLKPVVDATISSLGKAAFRTDPIGGERYSKATSVVSAAYKRHGQILERAILERLSDCSYFTVWRDPEFRVSSVADHAISGRNADIENSLPIELPYGAPGRTIQVDAVVFDSRVKGIRAYEVKRANGHFDSGKKRSILRDILATQALLRSYGDKRGFSSNFGEARVIAYYGVKPLPAPLCISGEEMDDHFVFSVYKYVEQVNDYFRDSLYRLLSEITGAPKYEPAELCERCPLHKA